MIKIPEEVIQEQENYRNKVNDFLQDKIEEARFKPYRVGMGVYEQRTSGQYMVRTRIPSGVLTIEQLKKIVDVAKVYGNHYVHLTTRQDIQFHKIALENTVKIIEQLLEVGIITKGTGGNTVRNIAASPLSGVSSDEVFDVIPYAEAVTSYLLKDSSVFNLPRKYKIAFSNSPEDTANATIADLGFIAKIKDGKKGFKVFGAGGLGGSPTKSILFNEFILDSEVLYYVQALKELFELEGDRTNKHKARIRFILYRLGEEAFLQKFNDLLNKVKERNNLDLTVHVPDQTYEPGVESNSTDSRLYKQKEKGYYAVYIHPENGNINCKELESVLEFIDSLTYKVSIRLTSTQGFFVRDLKGNDAEKLLAIIDDFSTSYKIDHSVACAGAATCKLGLCLSQNLLSAIYERMKNVDDPIKNQLPRIFISGCSNSCGQHHIGSIGFTGKAKRTENGLVPMYTVLFGGKVTEEETKLGVSFGDVPAKRIPDFLYKLALLIKEQGNQSTFEEFVDKNEEAIKDLIVKVANIEHLNETSSDLYYDFGSDERFSLKGRGPGECSAGVMDVIKLDLNHALTYLKDYNQSKGSENLYQAALSASRTLLILKGIDTTKDRKIFQEFSKHFIQTGFVKKEIQEVLDQMIDYKLGDVDELVDLYEDVKYLVERVQKMYESLSPQLEITLLKEVEISEKPTKETASTELIIDLKGVKCPMNFVKAKIELAKIQSGDTIGFYLDDGAPITNVPKSIEGEGHEVLSIDDSFNGYNLLMVKKK